MIDQVRPSELTHWIQSHGADAVVLDCREHVELQLASVKPQGFELVHIPMAGSVESLNVSVATGIVLFELLRQAPK